MTPLPHDDGYWPSDEDAIAAYEDHPKGTRVDEISATVAPVADDVPQLRQEDDPHFTAP